MTPERWQLIQEKLATALALVGDERVPFLEALAAEDPALHAEVASLLAQEPAMGKFLDTDSARGLHRDAGAAKEMIGQSLGPYRITALLGEGGMGEVYRASRDDAQYEKEVAIKVVRAGRDSRLVVERFRQERQILANLSHANVASLLDGGVAEDGTPYLVMELVVGEPITDYCRRHGLGITQRLELFLQVCSAVQYAHQRLIVHRDLKPGNIFVTADGVPKLLDFGIAKLLDADAAATAPDPTMTLLRALTPAYASPEQIRGEPITTAGDVYSLGVVLYELLTGVSPYGPTPGTALELSRAVCETEPRLPSAALRRLTTGDAGSAAGGVAAGDQQVRRLRGDLDAIVLKALRKEPEQRYATAEGLADDIRRFLAHLPVQARKGTRRYRAGKFVARHKLAVGAATAAVVFITIGVLGVLREARIAERRFNDVRQMTHAMIFDVHDAIKALPGSTPARKLIVERALDYLRRIGDEAQGDIGLQREVASSYERLALVQGQYLQASLGDAKGSLDSYQRAYLLRQRVAAASSDWHDRLALAKAGGLVAIQQFAVGQVAEAKAGIAPVLQAIEALEREHPGDETVIMEADYNYEFAGQMYEGDAPAVEAYYKQMMEAAKRLVALRPDDLPTLDGYGSNLANYGDAVQKRDLPAAIRIYEESLAAALKVHERAPAIAQYSRDVAVAYSRVGNAYTSLGDHQKSYENLRKGLDVSAAIAAEDPQNATFQQGLAIAYANTGDALCQVRPDAKCLEDIDAGLRIEQGLVNKDPANKRYPHLVAALTGVRALAMLRLGRWEAALDEFIHASRIEQPGNDVIMSAGSPLAEWRVEMGQAAARAGKIELARRYFSEALAVLEPALRGRAPDDDVVTLSSDAYAWLAMIKVQEAKRTGAAATDRHASWVAARDYYRRSQEALGRMAHPHPVAFDVLGVGDPKRVAAALVECEAALAVHGT